MLMCSGVVTCVCLSTLVACKPSQPSKNQLKTDIPITGAFGFTLGEKLPSELELNDGYCFINNYTDAPPFSTIQLACLPDRTIYTIIGHAYSNSSEVVAALKSKYGPGEFYHTTNINAYNWTNGDGRLNADKFGKYMDCIHVTYSSQSLQKRSFDELEKTSHATVTNLAPKL